MSEPSKRKAGETRGLKKGQRHAGQFTSNDPRRLTLTPQHRQYRATFAEKCKAHADDVVDFLHSTMMNTKGEGKIRMEAAKELANRGFGKSVGVDVVANLGGNDKAIKDVAALSDDAILTLLINAGATPPKLASSTNTIIEDAVYTQQQPTAQPTNQDKD